MMRPLAVLGIVLIVFGLVALFFGEIPYKTETDRIEIGPIEATVEQEKSLAIPQMVGIASLAVGVILLIVGRRRT